MNRPVVIFLNGTSSAGKTSIAKTIQEQSSIPFLHLEIDTFLSMVRFEHIDCEEIDGVNAICARLISGFHSCFRAMVQSGNCLIVDHVLQEPEWFQECLEALKEFPVYFVGVRCNLDELERRERERGNRPIGLARTQYDRVHLNKKYDVEIHSDRTTPSEAATIIMDLVARNPLPTAFIDSSIST